jgi:hypothetical protein
MNFITWVAKQCRWAKGVLGEKNINYKVATATTTTT